MQQNPNRENKKKMRTILCFETHLDLQKILYIDTKDLQKAVRVFAFWFIATETQV